MSDPRSITADAMEILVTRELRKAGLEPIGLRRHSLRRTDRGFDFDLIGRLQAYEHKWTALIACSNRTAPITSADIDEIRKRGSEARLSSVLLCTTADLDASALARAKELTVAALQVVDAQDALIAAGMIQAGQLPAWVPEFTMKVMTAKEAQLIEVNEPELILRALRPTA